MKKAKVTKAEDGLYEVNFPDGTSKYARDKATANWARDKFNESLKK